MSKFLLVSTVMALLAMGGAVQALPEGCVKKESSKACFGGKSKTCVEITSCKNPANNVAETCSECK